MAERYKIYEKLGAGGVGAVFRAYDSQLKRWVAIKRLLSASEAESQDASAEELRREADALASLRNPNIVTIFDVASDAEGLFMVMELLEGEDLADVVARGPLHYEDFKELASQTLEGLLAAHQRHILHRDIKPENIKVERLPGGRLQSKIIDFGLARAGLRARKQTENLEGTVMGSIYYMAPEQLTREPVDERTDLYSLGCVFFEALSGRKAFDGDSMEQVIDKHIDHDIVPLHVVAPHVPPWLGAWVLRLMAQKPEERPVSAQQAIEEFRAWEKMAAAPAVMPWMPYPAAMPGYPAAMPGYPAAPGSHTQPMAPTGGHYPQAQPEEAVAYAQPVVEVVPEARPVIVEMAAHTAPLASAPARPAPRGSSPVRPPPGSVRSSPSTAKKGPPTSGSNLRLYGMIGGGVFVVAIGVWMLMSGGGAEEGTSTSGGAATTSIIGPSGPPKVSFELPRDRSYPPVDKDLCLHLVANTGTLASRKTGDGKNAPANDKEPVVEWHDLAVRGNDNFLRAFQNTAAHAPLRVNWPAAVPRTAGIKDNRRALDFSPRAGKPCALNLTETAAETNMMPFGGAGVAGEKGLTFGMVFQVDASRLPTRVATLSNNNGVSVTFRVDASKGVIAEIQNGNAKSSITSKNVDVTQPMVVSLTWRADNWAVEMRVRDAPNKFFSGKATVAPPQSALNRLQLGMVQTPDKKPVTQADQFAGFMGDVIMYAIVLKPDQVQLMESKSLRDYYIQGNPPPSAIK